MLNCKDITKLISDSLDRKLSFRQRLEVWFHMAVCGMCRRFRSTVIELRRRVRHSKSIFEPTETPENSLPPATKSRLEAFVKRQLSDES